MSDLVRVVDVHKNYYKGGSPILVLKGININIRKGEFVSIQGVSGVGKSTLLHLIGGLDKPTSGEIYIDNMDIARYSDWELADIRNTYIGFVFQFHHLLPEFNALENVAMPLLIRRESQKEALEKSEAILKLVGLADRMDHRPSELSGGEQQRVSLARALVVEPAIVLADEPTGNLDVKTGMEMAELMADICRKTGRTFLVATHNQDLAGIADRRLKLEEGLTVC
jgi:lipoprotein-releasing system ATP-binding protein